MSQPFRVFVAMRIGEADTDALFSRSIVPTIRACGGRGVRIDKVEHNDAIDQGSAPGLVVSRVESLQAA